MNSIIRSKRNVNTHTAIRRISILDTNRKQLALKDLTDSLLLIQESIMRLGPLHLIVALPFSIATHKKVPYGQGEIMNIAGRLTLMVNPFPPTEMSNRTACLKIDSHGVDEHDSLTNRTEYSVKGN